MPTVRYDTERRVSFQEELAARFVVNPRRDGSRRHLPSSRHRKLSPLVHSHRHRTAGRDADRSQPLRDAKSRRQRAMCSRPSEFRCWRDAASTSVMTCVRRSACVVSANFARAAFPGVPFEGVLGQRLAAGREHEIIGVVGDVALDVYGAPTMVVYRAHRQFADNRNWALTQVVATERSTDESLSAVGGKWPDSIPSWSSTGRRPWPRSWTAARVESVSPSCSWERSRSSHWPWPRSVSTACSRMPCASARLRLASGSRSAQLRHRCARFVFRQAAVVVGLGIVAGLAGALVLGRWLEALAFGIAPTDSRILMASAIVLTVVAIVAVWLPAQRAARVEPRMAIQESR